MVILKTFTESVFESLPKVEKTLSLTRYRYCDSSLTQVINKLLPYSELKTIDIDNLLITYKSQYLKTGQSTADYIVWHYDNTPVWNPSKTDKFLLIHDSPIGAETQFVETESPIKQPLNKLTQELINTTGSIITIPNNTLVTYTNGDLHRARPAMSPGWRHFLRIEKSDRTHRN